MRSAFGATPWWWSGMSSVRGQLAIGVPDSAARPDSDRLRDLLQDCVRRRAAGEVLPDEQLIRENPDLMPALVRELELLRLMRRAADRARDGSSGIAGHSEFDRGSDRILVRPDAIPGYRLIREIHRGGQGLVYLAHQESTCRDCP